MQTGRFYRGDRVFLRSWTQAEVIWHDWSIDVVTVKRRGEGLAAPGEQSSFLPEMVRNVSAREVALEGRFGCAMQPQRFYRGDRVRLLPWTQAEVIWHDWSIDAVTVKRCAEASADPWEQSHFLPEFVRIVPALEVELLQRSWYSAGDLVDCYVSAAPGLHDGDDAPHMHDDDHAWRRGRVLWHDWMSDMILVERNEVCSWEGSSSLVRRIAPQYRRPRRSITELHRESQLWISASLFPIADLLLRRLDVASSELPAAEKAVLKVVARSSCSTHEWNVMCCRAWNQLSSLVQSAKLVLDQNELIGVAEALLAEDLPSLPGLFLLRLAGLTDEILALVEIFVRKPDMLMFRGVLRHLERIGLAELANRVRARRKKLLYHAHADAGGLALSTWRWPNLDWPQLYLLELREDGTFSYSHCGRSQECEFAAEGTWDMHAWGGEVQLQGLQVSQCFSRYAVFEPARVRLSSFRVIYSRSQLLQSWAEGPKQEDDGYRAYQDGDRTFLEGAHRALWQWMAAFEDDGREYGYAPSAAYDDDHSFFSGRGSWRSDYGASEISYYEGHRLQFGYESDGEGYSGTSGYFDDRGSDDSGEEGYSGASDYDNNGAYESDGEISRASASSFTIDV